MKLSPHISNTLVICITLACTASCILGPALAQEPVPDGPATTSNLMDLLRNPTFAPAAQPSIVDASAGASVTSMEPVTENYELKGFHVQPLNSTSVEVVFILPHFAVGRSGKAELNYTGQPISDSSVDDNLPPQNATWLRKQNIKTPGGIFPRPSIKYYMGNLKPSHKYWFKLSVHFQEKDNPIFDDPLESEYKSVIMPSSVRQVMLPTTTTTTTSSTTTSAPPSTTTSTTTTTTTTQAPTTVISTTNAPSSTASVTTQTPMIPTTTRLNNNIFQSITIRPVTIAPTTTEPPTTTPTTIEEKQPSTSLREEESSSTSSSSVPSLVPEIVSSMSNPESPPIVVSTESTSATSSSTSTPTTTTTTSTPSPPATAISTTSTISSTSSTSLASQAPVSSSSIPSIIMTLATSSSSPSINSGNQANDQDSITEPPTIASWTEQVQYQLNAPLQKYALHLLIALIVMTILFLFVTYKYFKKSSRVRMAYITAQPAYDNHGFTKMNYYGDQNYHNEVILAKQKNLEVDKTSPLHAQHDQINDVHHNNHHHHHLHHNGKQHLI